MATAEERVTELEVQMEELLELVEEIELEVTGKSTIRSAIEIGRAARAEVSGR